MARLRLQIEDGNAAFGESEMDRRQEIGRILVDFAIRFERGDTPASGRLSDSNGNDVGRFSWGEE